MQIPRNNLACKFQGTLLGQKVIISFFENQGYRLRLETISPFLQAFRPLRMFKIAFGYSSLYRNNCLYFVCYG